jgi:hypothetical protein
MGKINNFIPSNLANEKLPVMAWINDGGYLAGGPSELLNNEWNLTMKE